MSPQRIQLRRTKGWRKPEGAIVVSRPSRWGNPWRVVAEEILELPGGDLVWCGGPGGARAEAVRLFHDACITRDVSPLRGHDLACWCPLDQPCHADVLLEIANR